MESTRSRVKVKGEVTSDKVKEAVQQIQLATSSQGGGGGVVNTRVFITTIFYNENTINKMNTRHNPSARDFTPCGQR